MVRSSFTRNRVTEAVERAVSWLLSEQRSDGSIGMEVPSYYKLPGIFQMTGHYTEASSLLDWICKNALGKDGWFSYDSSNYASMEGARRWTTYQNEWLIIGSHLLGRFDVSMKALETLLAHQHSSWGGFSYDREISRRPVEVEALSTGFGGLVCLFTGKLNEARRAGDFLVRLVAMQPDPLSKLYLTVHSREGLVTDFSEKEALMHVVDAKKTKQFYFFPGLMMAFLTKLYHATGRRRYLTAANRLLRFAVKCQPDVYSNMSSIKLGWGSAALHKATGDRLARNVAERIGTYLLDTQNDDGTWYSNAYLGDAPGTIDEYSHRMDLTAEFVVRLIEIAKDLNL